VLVQKTNLKISRPLFQQQHVVPQRRQREQNLDVRVQKLRLQATRRFQMYLRQQNYARNRRTDPHRRRRYFGPYSPAYRRPSLPRMQSQVSHLLGIILLLMIHTRIIFLNLPVLVPKAHKFINT
jgi:hypothetical protein